MRMYLVLLVLVVAILGALLHPLSFVLGLLPIDVRGLQSFLTSAKTLLADLTAWAVVALLIVMGLFIASGRMFAKRKSLLLRGVARRQSNVQPRIAVGIIAYNEEEAIAGVVNEFKVQPSVIEVIVVDNNSRDGTARRAALAGARVVRETQQGYGYACIRALRETAAVSDADVMVLTEGDATFSGDDLAKFVAYIGQADMVVGTRVVPGLVEKGSQMDYFFTWGNIAVGTLLRLRFWDSQFLGAARLSDVGCTYRAIRRAALERILSRLEVGGHHFSPHMIVVALSSGLSVIEIPVTFRRRLGVSKGAGQSLRKGLQVGLVMIWHILTFRPRVRALSPDPITAEGALQVVKR